MGWKGALRSLNAASKRMARDAKRKPLKNQGVSHMLLFTLRAITINFKFREQIKCG